MDNEIMIRVIGGIGFAMTLFVLIQRRRKRAE